MWKQETTVSLEYCSRYNREDVRQALKRAFASLGGLEVLVRAGQKVLLKPNLLAAVKPAASVTTHPAVIGAMAEMLLEIGARVYIGDSPGIDRQEEALERSGMTEVIAQSGAEPLLLSGVMTRTVNGFQRRLVPLASQLAGVDLVINMAKLKTHSLTGMTGAVKNTYGCIAGLKKARLHVEHPLPRDFSRLLVDVCLAVKPALSIIDAVVAMEGAGPRRGKSRHMGLLIASTNPFAADCVAAATAGFLSGEVSTISAAADLGLPGSSLGELLIRGVTIEDCRVRDFDRGPASSRGAGRMLLRLPQAWLRGRFAARRPYPRVEPDHCSTCMACYKHCPALAIEVKDRYPVIVTGKCIRCYCCQEFCDRGAIGFGN